MKAVATIKNNKNHLPVAPDSSLSYAECAEIRYMFNEVLKNIFA